ncbi:hypothetical protein HDU79_001121 [Rhizoclosmatium sp. JEL0117]|nr:hypothetical protein HDU79_001121 [Rhizoclosmatium sp. JEL0117]
MCRFRRSEQWDSVEANSFKCLGLNVKDPNKAIIDQEVCQSGDTFYQYFLPTQPSVFYPTLTQSKCKSYNYRKEWRDLTVSERMAYIKAVQGVRSLPSTAGRRSYFDDLVSIHASVIDYIHQTPSFWPWHRYYLRLFEEALQQIDPSVVLPYWDWGFDGDAPLANEDVFGKGSGQFGTRGDPNSPYPTCLKDGFAKDWTSYFGQCSSRNYTLDVVIYDDSAMYPLVLTSQYYDNFTKAAEAAHNVVHYYMGGVQGDLYFIDLSTNDPLFFVHHANVDRYWALWQYHHKGKEDEYTGTVDLPPGSNNQVTVQLSDLLPGWNVPVSYTMRADQGNGFCAKYVPYSQSTSAQSVSDQPPPTKPSKRSRRSQKTSSDSPHVSPIPSSWQMMSQFAKGYQPEGKAETMMGLSSSMLQRIREGEAVLDELSSGFKEARAKLLESSPEMTTEAAHFSILASLRAKAVRERK